jgi:hypothetical protein
MIQGDSFLASLNLSEKQLFELMHVPQTFFYLRVRSPPPNPLANSVCNTLSSGSVYELEAVAQDRVSRLLYFTLSKEGVTIFQDSAGVKTSTFTSLQQWEREYRLFNKISQIRFFQRYRRWKVYQNKQLLHMHISTHTLVYTYKPTHLFIHPPLT